MIYYIFDSHNYGCEAYPNEKDWKKAIDEYDFFGLFYDDGWSEEVTNVVAGIAPEKWSEDKFESDESYLDEQEYYEQYATHLVTKDLIATRPDDSEIDERGCSKDGAYYWGDFIEICSYRFIEKEHPND
jgi:hypothetical protein